MTSLAESIASAACSRKGLTKFSTDALMALDTAVCTWSCNQSQEFNREKKKRRKKRNACIDGIGHCCVHMILHISHHRMSTKKRKKGGGGGTHW